MKKQVENENLNTAFDLNPMPTGGDVQPHISRAIDGLRSLKDKEEQTNADKNFVRDANYDLIQQGISAADELRNIAISSQNARTFEVYFQGLKALSDLGDKILDAQEKEEKIKAQRMKNSGEEPQSGAKTVNNILFTGTPSELQDNLKTLIEGEKE